MGHVAEVAAQELKKKDEIDWGHGVRTKVMEIAKGKQWVVVMHRRSDYETNLRFVFRPEEMVTRL